MSFPVVPSNLLTSVKPSDIWLKEGSILTFRYATLGSAARDELAVSLVRVSLAWGGWTGIIYPEPPGRECSVVAEMVCCGLLAEKRIGEEAWLFSLTVEAIEQLAKSQAERIAPLQPMPPVPQPSILARLMYVLFGTRIGG